MPLMMMRDGEKAKVERIRGNREVTRRLNNLGLTENAEVMVVQNVQGNLIVRIRDCKVALARDLAEKIMVQI